MDVLGLAALGAVSAEWLVLGWLSGVRWSVAEAGWWAPRWALRLLVGGVLLAAVQLVLALTSVGFGNAALVLALSALVAGGLRWLGRVRPLDQAPVNGRRPASARDRRLRWSAIPGVERVAWLVLGGLLLAVLLRSLTVPEAGWDAFSHWGLRALAYAQAGAVVNAGSEHEYYPPLVPLLEAWLDLHRRTASLDQLKTLWAVVEAAFAVCLAWHLRMVLRRPWCAPVAAAGVVLATPALLEGAWTGQGDLPLTAWLTLACLAAWQYQRTGDPAWLGQAAVFSAAVALTKLEGLPSLGVLVLAIAVVALPRRVVALTAGLVAVTRRVVAQPPRAAAVTPARGPMPLIVALLGAALGASLLWLLTAARAGISPNSEHFGHFQPQALGDVLLSLRAVFGGLRTGGGIAIAALLWLIAGPQRLQQPEVRLLTVAVLGLAAATVLAFLISDAPPAIEVLTSATRLVEHWLPLALFAGLAALDQLPTPDACMPAPAPGGARHATYNRRGR